jgi:hypothetical protein
MSDPSPLLLPTLKVGSDIAVRGAYDGAWSRGFQVAALVNTADFPCYRVRRRIDNTVLAALFPASDVIPDLHRQATTAGLAATAGEGGDGVELPARVRPLVGLL